ncbi:hypothetical protein SAICODRAFT_6468 [Saitoella complicata NRRL Y-17804]|uniref:DUF4048 domain-containing protein n=1 Tax=Saitoella complicata (strain BCRC 22490 / CBS 7301 / JCM 7358 / NBRC 10748 / NRRL Y-17804) TaxID=698492 RepID=A0A0E9NR36_SAICN|nr:uncharacterized protein SAICODRAFT_6468 [Saitoella complicata NRRL Y-17804]ODQ54177.1 hypothetical protein SAICODRAFT_6468 [Saitoella complicata NRRL Y-17804]GAO52324.1 hypothetical protein G7K_6403-t1 [Saitoella complicata NRRL Y-17804]
MASEARTPAYERAREKAMTAAAQRPESNRTATWTRPLMLVQQRQHEHQNPNPRARPSHRRRRLSLQLPGRVGPPPTPSPAQSPVFTYGAFPSPVEQPAGLEIEVEEDEPADTLLLLAAQERRVLELKEELQREEQKLKRLQNQWAREQIQRVKEEHFSSDVNQRPAATSPLIPQLNTLQPDVLRTARRMALTIFEDVRSATIGEAGQETRFDALSDDSNLAIDSLSPFVSPERPTRRSPVAEETPRTSTTNQESALKQSGERPKSVSDAQTAYEDGSRKPLSSVVPANRDNLTLQKSGMEYAVPLAVSAVPVPFAGLGIWLTRKAKEYEEKIFLSHPLSSEEGGQGAQAGDEVRPKTS